MTDIRDRVKELRRVRAGDLVPNPKNWRRHPKAQIAALQGVLAEIGYADALLARETPAGLQLIDGHARASLDPEQLVPVLILDVDEAEADKLLLTLDPLAAMAKTSAESLGLLLKEVQSDDQGVQKMLEQLALDSRLPVPGREGLTNPDAVPETPTVPRSQRGDLWLLGEHRILCGDSTDAQDVGRLFGEERATLMATDPPYLVDYEHNEWDTFEGRARALEFFGGFLKLGLEFCKPGVAVYQWHATRRQAIVEEAWAAAGLHVHQTLVWVKPRGTLGRSDYMWRHEPALLGWVPGFEPAFYGWFKERRPEKDHRPPAHATTVWQIDGDRDLAHPTQKPVEIFARPIEYHTNPGEIVYEPFSGSGTQLIAAQRLGRRCFAMELAPAYVDVAVARWEAFTGQTARLQSGKDIAIVEAEPDRRAPDQEGDA